MKICSKCHAELPLSEFYKRGRGGHHSQCRACWAAYGAAWRAANPRKAAAIQATWRAAHPEEQAAYHLKRKYDLTPADRDEMLEQQGGLCAIRDCGLPATHVDHCHDCNNIDRRGSVRGILCRQCNPFLDHVARFSPMHAAYMAAHATVCRGVAS